MLQNRVNPFGDLIRTPARGTLTGTRGVIHNARKEIVRPFKHKAWITCLLDFKGRRRTVMSPNRYTELFFLDEATAFAAGHRPCAECRRHDYVKFKTAWLAGNPQYGFDRKTSICKIDEVMHRERLSREKRSRECDQVPDGAFIQHEEQPWLKFAGMLHLWTPAGYTLRKSMPTCDVLILTPVSIINALNNGYEPRVFMTASS